MNGSLPMCKCFYGYFGSECSLDESFTKMVKDVQFTSVLIAFVIIGVTVFTILANDGFNLFIRKRRSSTVVARHQKHNKINQKQNFKYIN